MSYKIIGKYIKDLRFNIPNPKTFFLLSKNISNYKINIDIKSVQVKQNIIEVLTSLSLSPSKDDFDKIETKIIYSTIVELSDKNTNKEEIENIVLIKVPNEIYSELRQIFIFLFENSGFKDIKINEKIDFEKLYKIRKTRLKRFKSNQGDRKLFNFLNNHQMSEKKKMKFCDHVVVNEKNLMILKKNLLRIISKYD